MTTASPYIHAADANAIVASRGPALLLVALASAFFARVLTTAGAPAALNFAHFGIVPLVAFYYAAVPMRSVPRTRLLIGLYVFVVAIITSALVNGAGLFNVGAEWLLLSEPFLLLVALGTVRWSPQQIAQFRYGILLFAAIHALFAVGQYVTGAHADDVKGVFLEQGAGHHVGGAVALTAALYFYIDPPARLERFRHLLALLFLSVVYFSDTKQALAVFLLAGIVLVLIKQGAALRGGASMKRVGGYFVLLLIAAGSITWAAHSFFPALKVWADPERIQTGVEQKLSAVPILVSHFDTEVQWAVGVGPGHSVGRLGLLLPNYADVLEPLDATTHPATQAVVSAKQSHWISRSGTGSSIWSPTFSYAGIWGDLGIVGLLIYLGLWGLTWRHLCPDDLSRFLLLTVLVFGGVFAWLEEPGYMLVVASLIGLRHQERNASMVLPK